MPNYFLLISTKLRSHHLYAAIVISLYMILNATHVFAQQDQTRELMRLQIEKLRIERSLNIADATVGAFRVIPELYERRNFDLEWRNSKRIDNLLAKIYKMNEEGLDPEDYHYQILVKLRKDLKSESTPAKLVELDILLTESLIRLGYHLRFGKVNPYGLDPDWNLSRELNDTDPVGRMRCPTSFSTS